MALFFRSKQFYKKRFNIIFLVKKTDLFFCDIRLLHGFVCIAQEKQNFE